MKEIENNQWIANYRTDQPHFGLERMVELLALRGNPHLKLKVLHIGGTNGKGSTIAFLKKMLEKLGLRVGVFSSPYLIHYTDQISINGESISEARLEALMADYQSLLEEKRSPIYRAQPSLRLSQPWPMTTLPQSK